jgi:NAD(P)-dependent dehydrogenase (short-subunit alcohol dehydrogenase family)
MPTAIVTGAARGIGRSICDALAAAGYGVIGLDRSFLPDFPYRAVTADICELQNEDPSLDSLCGELSRLVGGKLDLLVNNAAHQVVTTIAEATPEHWHDTLGTNLLAPFWLTKGLLADLQESRGCVVNISSVHARLTKPGFSLYATSKAALVSLTRSMALELAPHVRVNAILPAATDTPMLAAGFAANPELADSLAAHHPLQRIARSDEIAQAVVFLGTPASSFVTGTALNVDGGIAGLLHDPGALQ